MRKAHIVFVALMAVLVSACSLVHSRPYPPPPGPPETSTACCNNLECLFDRDGCQHLRERYQISRETGLVYFLPHKRLQLTIVRELTQKEDLKKRFDDAKADAEAAAKAKAEAAHARRGAAGEAVWEKAWISPESQR